MLEGDALTRFPAKGVGSSARVLKPFGGDLVILEDVGKPVVVSLVCLQLKDPLTDRGSVCLRRSNFLQHIVCHGPS